LENFEHKSMKYLYCKGLINLYLIVYVHVNQMTN